MRDRVESVMDKAIPTFMQAATARASLSPTLASLVPVARDPVAAPYRQTSRLRRHPDPCAPGLSRLCAALEWAHEVHHCEEFAAEELDVPAPRLQVIAEDFAVRAIEVERAAIFALLTAPTTRVHPLDEATLRSVVRSLGGACRFVGRSAVADDAKKVGWLDDVQSYPGGGPPGTGGMVLRLDQGPLVRRLGDDHTLTWGRAPRPDVVEIELSSRFFLDRPHLVRWFPPA